MKQVFVRALSALPIDALQSWVERARILRVSRRLARCGARITFSRGFQVEAPGTVSIEDDASFAPCVSIMGVGGCSIGRNTMVATGVLILTTTHDRKAEVMRDSRVHRAVLIEDNVWIGAAAILLPGAVVRCGAVVAAGAVVSGEVKRDHVVAGVPARLLYERHAQGR